MIEFWKKQHEKDKKEREEKEKTTKEMLIRTYTTLARTYAATYPLADKELNAEEVFLKAIIAGGSIALAPFTEALKRE